MLHKMIELFLLVCYKRN